MSWILQVISAILVALGLGSFAEDLGLKVDHPPVASARVRELGETLKHLGYQPEQLTPENGIVAGFKIDLNTGEYEIPASVHVSADEQSMILTADLSPLGDLRELSAADLATLLAQNNLEESPYVLGLNQDNVLTLQITEPFATPDEQQLQDALVRLQDAVDYSALRYFFLTAPVDDAAGTVPVI